MLICVFLNFSPEDIYRQHTYHDKLVAIAKHDSDECFCWCFWTFKIRMLDLRRSHSIQVRAMDDSLALQPRDIVGGP